MLRRPKHSEIEVVVPKEEEEDRMYNIYINLKKTESLAEMQGLGI
jgi:hypothetical protein